MSSAMKLLLKKENQSNKMDEPDQDATKTFFPGIPTDLPQHRPITPGTPLSHQYQPGEGVVNIIAPALQPAHRIASEVNYDPVTTYHLEDRSVFVRPVQNLRTRHITPLPLRGPLNLPIRGERVFDISEEFQRQMEKRLGTIMANYETKAKIPIPTPPQPPQVQAQSVIPKQMTPVQSQ